MLDFSDACPIFAALVSAVKDGQYSMKLSSMEQAEKYQRFITGIVSATGLKYITTINRDKVTLDIKVEK